MHNVRSLSKHVDDIVTETQISLSDSTCRLVQTLSFFNLNFKNSENKFLSLAYGYRNNVAVLDKSDGSGISIDSFKKHAFADRVFTLMLVYRKHSMPMQEFFFVGIVAGDFNFDLLKV